MIPSRNRPPPRPLQVIVWRCRRGRRGRAAPRIRVQKKLAHHFDAIKAATHWLIAAQELHEEYCENGCGPSEDRRNRPVIMAEDRCNQRLKSLIFCRRGCKKGCVLTRAERCNAPVVACDASRPQNEPRRGYRDRRDPRGTRASDVGESRSSLAAGPRRRGARELQTPHTTTEARPARPHAGRRGRDARGGRRHPVQAHLPHRAAGAAAVQLWSGRGRGGQ